jgi:lysyl-tRNA synthetase class 2
MDLVQDFTKVQLVLMNRPLGLSKEDFGEYVDQFKKGDHVIALGHPGVTNVGELSLKLTQNLIMASPIMHPIPPKLNDLEKRHHNRVVDFLVNKRSQDVIISRSRILKSLRLFFEYRGFIEVDTPTISANSNGANATPFITHSKHMKHSDDFIPLQLRVAPELWLKRLVIGGFDKVFEVSKVFRNEGIDATHNPEFTTCEFYQTFTTLEELMEMTEQMFRFIGEEMVKYDVSRERAQFILDQLDEGFKKLEFIPEVEKATGLAFPEVTEQGLLGYLDKLKVPHPKIKSIPHLLDKLSSEFLEPQCEAPTFIYHQPSQMSPLSKSMNIEYPTGYYDISRRFELFINGKEFINAYEEENSPLEQSVKFSSQQREKDQYHDDEAPLPDIKYVEAMEWGLPPTGGWGMGVDRFCMYLCGEERIEEVLTFGTLPDVTRQ